MIKRLRDFLAGQAAPGPASGSDELQLAVAALLIEAARMDDDFSGAERAAIERILGERYHLPKTEVQELVTAAEEAVRGSTQFFPFTRRIVQQISHEDRAHILEMMWEVAYADGELDPHEDALLRRIAGLIHVSDRDRGEARQRALAKVKGK